MKFILLSVLGVVTIFADGSQILRDFSVGNNLFAANVYKELLKFNSGSFLVCPLSAEVILGLILDGSEGKTGEQLSSALDLPSNKNKAKQIFRELIPRLKSGDKYTLDSANKIYVKDGYKIQPGFKSTAGNVFKAEIQTIDFENEKAASEMNEWVEEKTHGKIKNLINKDDLDEDTRSVLINAMYFHGQWVHGFPDHATAKKTFYTSSGKKQVDMMQQLSSLNYYESAELKAKFLELPYEGNDITMTIVLPNDKDGLASLETQIADILVSPKYDRSLVEVIMPKFKLETTIEFKPILQALGATAAFADEAEFGKIIEDQPLKISKVVQKTSIEVEEHGTIASAASAVEIPRPLSEDYTLPPVMSFTADHPFIYYIKINEMIFFIGRYTGI